MSDYPALKAEIALPKYGGMTDQQIASAINAEIVTTMPSPFTLSGGPIYNAIVPSEFAALTADQKQNVRDVISAAAGGVDVSSGTNARAVMLAVFGAGTTTRANLAALVAVTITRAEQLGWPRNGITIGEIAAARKV